MKKDYGKRFKRIFLFVLSKLIKIIIIYVISVTLAFIIALKVNMSVHIFNLITYVFIAIIGTVYLSISEKKEKKEKVKLVKHKKPIQEDTFEWVEK